MTDYVTFNALEVYRRGRRPGPGTRAQGSAGVRLRVRKSTLGEGLALLSAGEVEFVVGARDPLKCYALEYHEMLDYDIVLIASRNHPLAGRETVTPKEAAK